MNLIMYVYHANSVLAVHDACLCLSRWGLHFDEWSKNGFRSEVSCVYVQLLPFSLLCSGAICRSLHDLIFKSLFAFVSCYFADWGCRGSRMKCCGKGFYKSFPTLSSPCGVVFTSPVHVHAVQLTVQYFFSKLRTLITPPTSQDSNKCVFILFYF